MRGQKAYEEAKQINQKIQVYPSGLDDSNQRKLYFKYLKLIRKAAYIGNLESQYDLAQQYETMSFLDMNNPMFNAAKRIYWYTKACDQNHDEACNNLASIYELGEGCDIDLNRALELYKKSSYLGSPNGKKNYKIMLKDLRKGGRYAK